MAVIVKKIARIILPNSLRYFFGRLKPKVFTINTLVLEDFKYIEGILEIPENYQIRDVSWDDKNQLKQFYDFAGSGTFERKVPKRLNSPNCKGFAVFDKTSGNIVYASWLIQNYETYLREYKIEIKTPWLFWESALCLPEHRHKGLHERVEQEVINYSSSIGVKYLYIQILKASSKGNKYAISKGYKVLKESKAISIPAFDVFRNLSSFLKNPLKRIEI